jgi:hypothetical protein
VNLLNSAFRTFTCAGIYAPKELQGIQDLTERSHANALKYDVESERLKAISQVHIEEGLHYDGQESFFDAIRDKGADCQGMSFLYSLVMSQFPDTVTRLIGFKNDTKSDSHVALKFQDGNKIWETTKPGLIDESEITNSGYPIVINYPQEAIFDLPEAISLAHMRKRDRDRDILRFLDLIIINDGKYPSAQFYLKHKLKALSSLHKEEEISLEEYYNLSRETLEALEHLEPGNLAIALQQVKLNLEFDQNLNLNHNIEILKSFDTQKLRDRNSEQAQEYFFVLGQCFLLNFIQTKEQGDKKQAIQNFEEVLRYDFNPGLKIKAENSLRVLHKN